MPGSPSLPVTADITFDHADPYAVRVAFHTGGSDIVEWTFARALLTDGVTRPVGEGDVQVQKLLIRLMGIGYTGWITMEWEKAWLPGLAVPWVAA